MFNFTLQFNTSKFHDHLLPFKGHKQTVFVVEENSSILLPSPALLELRVQTRQDVLFQTFLFSVKDSVNLFLSERLYRRDGINFLPDSHCFINHTSFKQLHRLHN